MNRLSSLVLLVSSLFAYAVPGYGYSYFPSQNLIPSQPAYNFNIYYDAKFNTQVSFTAPGAADDQIHTGNTNYYLINFEAGAVKLHHLVLSAVSGVNAYVINYRLQGSVDGVNFFDINAGAVYPGLRNAQDVATFYFANVIWARQLRFIPIDYFGQLSFNLGVYYDDESIRQPTAPVNKAFINNYLLPANQASQPFLAPAGYQNYRTDLFNGVNYFAAAPGIDTRYTNSNLSGHNYNDVVGSSPFDILGAELLQKILNHFYDDILIRNSVLGGAFAALNPIQHKKLVLEFFSNMLGAGIPYTGKEMERAHQGLAVLDPEFDLFINLITRAFTDFNIDSRIIAEVVRRLETYRKEVINK